MRANYLAAGAVDVAVDTGDAELLDALRRQWDRTIARRTYITGGQGSHHQDEAFGDDWELPPDRAYSETCAGIGSVMFAWRLLLADGDARYADLIERTLYNVVATSPSDDGRVVLLRQHPPPAGARHPRRPRRDLAARVLVAARAVVRGVVLPAERRAHAREPRLLRRDRRRRRACSCTSTRRPRCGRRSPTDGASPSTSTTHYPEDGLVRVSIVDGTAGEWTLGAARAGMGRGRSGAGDDRRRARRSRMPRPACTRSPATSARATRSSSSCRWRLG